MAYDGMITIGTNLVTDKFDKQFKKLDEKIKEKERESMLVSVKIKNLENSINEYDRLRARIQGVKKEIKALRDEQKTLNITPEFRFGSGEIIKNDDEKRYVEINERVKDLNLKLSRTTEELRKQSSIIDEQDNKYKLLKAQHKNIKDEIVDYQKELNNIDMKKKSAQLDELKEGINSINKSIKSSVAYIGKLAFGIIGVSTAYNVWNTAVNTLAQYDKEYATNLEYIRYLIAQAIAPALKYVVNLASTLLSYLNYILNAWFGITLFSKNSAKNFMNAKNSTGRISKNTGKIKKDLQTTSFDEMNVLSDTSSSGTSRGAGGGAIAPSIDPSVLQGEVPDWVKWIAENKDLVIGALTGIAIAIGLIKLSDLIGGLKNLGALLEPIKTFLTKHGKTLAGILAIIGGIAMIIDGVIKYLKDPSWENFIEIMAGIALVVGGVMLLFGGIPALITAIILILGALGLAIYKHWDEVKAVLSKVGQWIYDNIITPVMNFFKALFDTILSIIKTAISIISGIFTTLVEILKNPFVVLWETVKGLFESIKLVFTGIVNIIRGIFTGDIRQVFEGAKQIFRGFANAIWTILKAPINFLIGGISHE